MSGSTLNAVPFRSTIFYTAAGTPAALGTVFTVGANGIQSTTNALGLQSLIASTMTASTVSFSTMTASTILTQASTITLAQNVNVPNRFVEIGCDLANSMYFDFHSSDGALPDYSTRIISQGGATTGTGNLNMYASTIGLMVAAGVGIGTTVPSSAILHVGSSGIVRLGPSGNIGNTSAALLAEVARYQIGFSAYRDIGTDQIGSKIVSINYNGWANSNPLTNFTELAFFTTSQTSGGAGYVDTTTERMRITAAGNVGIGTTNPSDRLTILGPSSATISGGYAAISLYNSNGGQNLSGSDVLSTQISMGPYGPYFQAKYANNTYTDSMRLDICTGAASNNTTPVPRISVLSGINSGYVGIGTTAPLTNFEVYNNGGASGTTQANITNFAGGATTTNSSVLNLRIQGAGGGIVDNQISAQYNSSGVGTYSLALKPNGTTVMTVIGSGNVGIGLTNPNVALQVNGAINSINTTFNVTTSATNLYALTNGQSGWLFLRWGNGNSLYFFQWYGGVNSSSINLICTAGGGNTVTAALPSTTITLVSNTTMTVYYTITFMT